jgi:hypothetical protein
MCTNLDTGAHAGPVPFLPHESIGTASECLVSMGQNKKMSWLHQACFWVQCPCGKHFAVGMHVMLALAGEHGMQLERAPVPNFVKILRRT